MNSTSSALARAFQSLEDGHADHAEEIVRKQVKVVGVSHGKQSTMYAEAQNDLAQIMRAMGNYTQAIDAMKIACEIKPGTNEEANCNRITYILNLGQILLESGDLRQAESILRWSAEERLKIYGRESTGYAFGLEPIAEVLHRLGSTDEACDLIDEAIGIYWNSSCTNITSALALKVWIWKDRDPGSQPLAEVEHWPDELIEPLVDSILERVENPHIEPKVKCFILDDLLDLARMRLGKTHRCAIDILAVMSNAGMKSGDHSLRIWAYEEIENIYSETNDHGNVCEMQLSIAVALADAGRFDDADKQYRSSLDRAKSPAMRANVMRNYGLFLSEQGRKEDAERMLAAAVKESRSIRDLQMLSRSLIALGIFLQHEGSLKPASNCLIEALELIDPSDPDAIAARSHLGAVQAGDTCGCGSMDNAIAQSLRDFILTNVTRDLLDDVIVEMIDGEFSIQVDTSRELSNLELEKLDRLILEAMDKFTRNVSS